MGLEAGPFLLDSGFEYLSILSWEQELGVAV